jgi:hypothetical protein
MKFALFTFVAAVSVVSVTGDKDAFKIAKWCCFDSDEKCSDACAWINDCDVQAKFGKIPCKTFTLDAMGLMAVNGLNPWLQFNTIKQVPAACRANTNWKCCDADDGYGTLFGLCRSFFLSSSSSR